jgi:sugar phosphate permease
VKWKPRHSVLGVLFIVYLLCYIDRMVMATAIPFIAADFGLSALEMGGVMSAFFLGYSLMQVPGGMLTDKVGARRVISVSTVCWSILTGLTGAMGSLGAMIAIRLGFGLSEGVVPPATAKTIAAWFPQDEVGRANGIKLAATQIAPALAPLFVTFIVAKWGWREVFYSLMIPGLMLAFVAHRFITDGPPRQDARSLTDVGAAEQIFGNGSAGSRAMTRVRFVEVMRAPAIAWCVIAIFFANLATWGLMNWLPTYLLQARGFSLSRMGVFASLPFVAGTLGFYLGGLVTDRYFDQRRHLPIVIGLIVSAVTTYFAGIAHTGEEAVFYLVATLFFLCIALSGIFTMPLILVSRRAVGTAAGIVNTGGQVAAFVSPLLVGYLLSVNGGDFAVVFYSLTAFLFLAALAATRIRGKRGSAATDGECASGSP